MKKSLLGFLALAGVLVGCQNYDDQFDALNQQILELQTELDGLTDIETDLAALVSDLSDLSDTVQDIEDNALTGNDLNNALAGVLSTLEQLRDRLSDLEQDVADIDVESQVASATADIDSEVADLNEEIERIEAAVANVAETVNLWLRRSNDRRLLAMMSQHLLEDIGLTEADVARESAKYFWQQ